MQVYFFRQLKVAGHIFIQSLSQNKNNQRIISKDQRRVPQQRMHELFTLQEHLLLSPVWVFLVRVVRAKSLVFCLVLANQCFSFCIVSARHFLQIFTNNILYGLV